MPTSSCHTHAPDSAEKRQILAGARKAQTHLTKVVAMLEDDVYCVDVLQQALAVQGLWRGVIRRVFAKHLRTCFQDAMRKGSPKDQERVVNEILRVMELSDRS